jgi:hypothetical protein
MSPPLPGQWLAAGAGAFTLVRQMPEATRP